MSLQHVEKLAADFFQLMKGRVRLFTLEFNLAKMSVAPTLFLALFLFILISSTWLTFTALIAYLSYTMLNSFIIGLLSAIIVNIILIIAAVFCLKKLLMNMKFLRTRKHFKKPVQDTSYANTETVKATD